MKKLLVLIIMLLGVNGKAQNAVVHINAEFNKSNDWYGLNALSDVKVYNGYLETNAAMQKKYNISKVPTLILYKDGVEVKRWEAGLDMKLSVTTQAVQTEIDRL